MEYNISVGRLRERLSVNAAYDKNYCNLYEGCSVIGSDCSKCILNTDIPDYTEFIKQTPEDIHNEVQIFILLN